MKRIATLCFVVLMCIATTFVLSGCFSNNQRRYASCRYCHKTYSYESSEYGNYASRNVVCIANTNLCISCYYSMCYETGRIPTRY